jgi:hypothetical protein
MTTTQQTSTTSRTPVRSVLGGAGRVLAPPAGAAIAVAFGAVARARSAKGLHPRGAVYRGRLHRQGIAPATGVPWLDAPGQDEVLVRFSRGAGLPPPLPDALGLAVRILNGPGEPSDLLLSSTAGRAPVLRHLLAPRRDPRQCAYTSIVGFRTPSGPVMIGAFPDGAALSLAAARPGGPWQAFGRIDLEATPSTEGADADVDFDPMLHEIPLLHMPDALARLREPSYRASRRARRDGGTPGGARETA